MTSSTQTGRRQRQNHALSLHASLTEVFPNRNVV